MIAIARLWLASCAPALDPLWAEQQQSLFSGSEQARLVRINRWQRRAQFIAGHVLARQLLQFALGRAVTVEVAADGRPLLIAAEPWTLSLSHSGSWVAALLAEGAAGVDIELERPLRDAAALRAWVDGSNGVPPHTPATDHATLCEWTLAEARLKAGVATPVFYARWDASCRDTSTREILWLAVAGVADLPTLCIADLAARSYNDCSLAWNRLPTGRDER